MIINVQTGKVVSPSPLVWGLEEERVVEVWNETAGYKRYAIVEESAGTMEARSDG